jgi:hypothetical protein
VTSWCDHYKDQPDRAGLPSVPSPVRRPLDLKIRHGHADGEDTPSTKGTTMAKRIFHSRTFLIVAVGLGTIASLWSIISQFGEVVGR